ncbi:MAG: FeoA family protein [Spirochaetota bacterium]
MHTYRLRDIPVGELARIVHIKDTHREYRSKLLSMGLTRGTLLQVRNIAPLGDPILISVRGFDLSLRKDEADALVLERVTGDPEEHGFRPCRARGFGRRRGFGRGNGGRPHGRRGRFGRGLGWGRGDVESGAGREQEDE